jgi:hypothetical protein
MPAHLGLDVHHAAQHDRGLEHAEIALGKQAFPFGGELPGADREPAAPPAQRVAQFLAVHAVNREGERHPQRVRPEEFGQPDRLIALRH